ncbi:MAG: hypothetical protein GF350_01035 [Chitinivibrionales bacterium]|nr:hypothetical protein [Chitinivibrionales bacterium]
MEHIKNIEIPHGCLSAAKKPSKPLIPVPESAHRIHDSMVQTLKELERSNSDSCLCNEFREKHTFFLDLFMHYQNEIISTCSKNITCSRGCACCCFHWVEDVYSFEAEIIADYLKTNRNDDIPGIIEQLRHDEAALIELDRVVDRTVSASPDTSGLSDNDRIDLLLACYYQLKRPCPLLDTSGTCTIYPLRPLTCRTYVSFFNPRFCRPDIVEHEDSRTYVLNCEETASEILDTLHFKYARFSNDTGLRSLLLKYLE